MKKILLLIALLLSSLSLLSKAEDGTSLIAVFQNEVDRRLDPPPEAQALYAQLLDTALKNTETSITTSQYVLMVDRNPYVQAIFLYWLDAQTTSDRWRFIGATSVSTGKPGKFEYFITPIGVFTHSLGNLDFRAQGTRNDFCIRGFGRKGMRVYDFGWILAERGWGKGGFSLMRLMLHATDPDFLEPRLGEVKSKGCIRIPTTLNLFIDRYGILDAEYEPLLEEGEKLWVMRPDRVPTPWAGRYLVIIDSGHTERPAWSHDPSAIELPSYITPDP